MRITREEVDHVSRLAKLALSEEDKEAFARQLEQILTYVDQLNALDTKGVVPTSHAVPVENVFREDRVVASLPLEQVLKNAPDHEKDCFRVPKIIE